MEYDSLSRCLGGEMVDTRDSKSRAKERGGSSPLQGVLTATLGGMFLCGANDLITIFVAPECFSLCSYLLTFL